MPYDSHRVLFHFPPPLPLLKHETSPNVLQMIKSFNKLAMLVSTEIVWERSIQARVKAISSYIQVGVTLLYYRFFSPLSHWLHSLAIPMQCTRSPMHLGFCVLNSWYAVSPTCCPNNVSTQSRSRPCISAVIVVSTSPCQHCFGHPLPAKRIHVHLPPCPCKHTCVQSGMYCWPRSR